MSGAFFSKIKQSVTKFFVRIGSGLPKKLVKAVETNELCEILFLKKVEKVLTK